MSSPRTPWRAFVALVQIALTVVLAAAGPGHHALAGGLQADRAIHAHAPAGHMNSAQAAGEDRTVAVAELLPADADDGPASHPCCPKGCVCHAFVTASDTAPQPARTGAGSALSPPPSVPFASAAPEAPPEPPRAFA